MRLFAFILLLLYGFPSLAQVKIGNDVSTIDPYSILELESNSKALVLTRVSNAVMNTMTPLNGALVFNTDTSCIHYYSNASWFNLCNANTNSTYQILNTNGNPGNLGIQNGNTIRLNVDDADASTQNELQSLQLIDQTISLSQDPNGTLIDLSNYDSDATDDFDGEWASLNNVPANLDTDSTDDFSGSFTDLTNVPANLDTDSTDDFSGAFADLTGVPANLDTDSTDDFDGEWASLNNVPANLDTDSTDDFSGSFADLTGVPANLDTDSTDDFDGAWTSLSQIPTGFSDNVDNVDDLDADPSNEYNTAFQVVGTNLRINDGGGFLQVPLNSLGTDDQGLSHTILEANKRIRLEINDGTNTTINIEDSDADTTNELQQLVFTNGSITLSNDPSSTSIDLSAYDTDASDDFDGEWGSLSQIPADFADNVDDVDDLDADPSNEYNTAFQVVGTNLRINDGGGFLQVPLNSLGTDDQGLSHTVLEANKRIRLEINDGTNTTINIEDSDADTTNEIQTLSISGDQLTISGSGGNSVTLPSSGGGVSGTSGSLFFADTDGSTTENNDQLFWNTTNNRLGVGTNTPTEKLEVDGNFQLNGSFKDVNGDQGTNGQLLSSTNTGTDWVDVTAISPTKAYGKISDAGAILNASGLASVVRTGTGNYTVAFAASRPTADYIIQLTVLQPGEPSRIAVAVVKSQSAADFTVEISEMSNANGVGGNKTAVDLVWYFTIID